MIVGEYLLSLHVNQKWEADLNHSEILFWRICKDCNKNVYLSDKIGINSGLQFSIPLGREEQGMVVNRSAKDITVTMIESFIIQAISEKKMSWV